MTKHDIAKLQSMADWMDSRFCIPGTSFRFGLDALLGLLPGVGDTVTLISTGYLISIAHAHELPWHVTVRMIWNAFIDWLIGLVPILGDIFDVGWKSNQMNLALLKRYIDQDEES